VPFGPLPCSASPAKENRASSARLGIQYL